MIAALAVTGLKWLCERSYKLGAKSTAELCEIMVRQRSLKLEGERNGEWSWEHKEWDFYCRHNIVVEQDDLTSGGELNVVWLVMYPVRKFAEVLKGMRGWMAQQGEGDHYLVQDLLRCPYSSVIVLALLWNLLCEKVLVWRAHRRRMSSKHEV
jgi:hypothetical protein